jgi:hypothetical protein
MVAGSSGYLVCPCSTEGPLFVAVAIAICSSGGRFCRIFSRTPDSCYKLYKGEIHPIQSIAFFVVFG